MEAWSSSLTAAEVIFHKRKVNDLEQCERAAQNGNVILNCQKRHSFHKMNNLKHISHCTVCARGRARSYYSNRRSREEKMRSSLSVCCGKRKKSISVHWCWRRVRAWKKKEPVRGWSCWQALNVQLPHITLHHTLCILTYSLLTGCEASFLSALEMKWPPCGHPTISSGN